jgi:hypothetical protein
VDERIRRIIAFVSAAAQGERECRTIVSIDTGATTQFQGTVDRHAVALFDIDDGAAITGTSDGHAFLLNDAHTGVDVKLWLRGNRLYGWILTSDQPFFGKVKDNEIIIRHPGEARSHRYLV